MIAIQSIRICCLSKHCGKYCGYLHIVDGHYRCALHFRRYQNPDDELWYSGMAVLQEPRTTKNRKGPFRCQECIEAQRNFEKVKNSAKKKG